MKNLHLLTILLFSVIVLSCSKDDDDNSNNPQIQGEFFEAKINGGTFSDYTFEMGAYTITNAANGTMSIDIADLNGEMITLFLNGTGGFSSNTVKPMGEIDANNFRTYGLIRQAQSQLSYFSSNGSVTITNNKEHPTESGKRLISGTFSIDAATTDGANSTSMTGTFNELEYDN